MLKLHTKYENTKSPQAATLKNGHAATLTTTAVGTLGQRAHISLTLV